MIINSFTGQYSFLSNFYGEGLTVEHLYQASKTHDLDWKEKILNAKTPGYAKQLGNKVPLRHDWEEVKVKIMADLLRKKFKDSTLGIKLVDTYPEKLIEGNTWHDNFWGACKCDKCFNKIKHNMLGFLLMQIRAELLGI